MAASAVPACDFVVFGGTGDLAMRKLLPALYLRDQDGQLPGGFRVIAVSRAGLGTAGYRAKADAELRNHLPAAALGDDRVAGFLQRLHYVSADADGGGDWAGLAGLLAAAPERVRVFYLACASRLYGPISRRLADCELVSEQARVVLEKPIGASLASARETNDEVGAIFSESQVFRIDHYLGKEAVQNLLVLRFANMLLEPLWNAATVDHVQITVSESIGAGQRAGYYDGSGALRDMIQNHLLQLLCLVAMEPPTSVAGDGVRDEKLKVLRALTGKRLDRHRLRPVSLDLTFAEQFGGRTPDAYERLLMDVVRGNPTLFMRRDEVEAAWEWTETILHGWQVPGAALHQYPAGTAGPAAGAALIERDGRRWHHEAAS